MTRYLTFIVHAHHGQPPFCLLIISNMEANYLRLLTLYLVWVLETIFAIKMELCPSPGVFSYYLVKYSINIINMVVVIWFINTGEKLVKLYARLMVIFYLNQINYSRQSTIHLFMKWLIDTREVFTVSYRNASGVWQPVYVDKQGKQRGDKGKRECASWREERREKRRDRCEVKCRDRDSMAA